MAGNFESIEALTVFPGDLARGIFINAFSMTKGTQQPTVGQSIMRLLVQRAMKELLCVFGHYYDADQCQMRNTTPLGNVGVNPIDNRI